MNTAIISSSKDKASTNIKESLVTNFNFEELEEKFDNNNIFQSEINDKTIKIYTINSELIHAESIDKSIDADLFVFISKHSAKEERKSLTVHVTGNFGKAEHGGREKALCMAPSSYMKNILAELNKNSKNSGYEATMEATHHGPFIEKPILFVEIGSSEKEWIDKNAGNIIAKSLIKVIGGYNNSINNKNNLTIKIDNKINKNKNYESVFIIGGSHYNHAANKAMLKSSLAVGHICAKYNLGSLDEGLIKEAMGKAIPKSKFVLLDWKGLGREKQRILDLLKKGKIEYRRSDKAF